MKKIIGIVGLANSGKSTVGDFFKKNYNFEQLSFATSLKDATSAIFGWPRYLLEGDTIESREFRETIDQWWSNKLGKTVTPRWALQYMGTDVIRQGFDNNIWIYSVERKIEITDKSIVITDVRFPNEIKMIKNLGGHLIQITRGSYPYWYNTAFRANQGDQTALQIMKDANIHSSEWAWIGNTNLIFENDSDIESLYKKIQNWYENV